MNLSKFRFTLDLHSIQSQASIPVMVGDTSVTLIISITDGGLPYHIEDGCLAKISIKRPTGTHLEEFCVVKNNALVEYPFSQNENTCAVPGVHTCDIILYGLDGGIVGTPRFTMVVSERVIRFDDIVLEDEDFTAVDAMIKQEVLRQEQERFRVEAENDRVEAEDKRNSDMSLAINTANEAKEQSNIVRTNLINLSAQVQGIGRNYVVPDFMYFIGFLNNVNCVELMEDRDGDGVAETYNVYVTDLKSGDNIIIIENGVPDFWFEKNSALVDIDSYTYNEVKYQLTASAGGGTIGTAHVLETDYTVIAGYATSASASANDAKSSASKAKESEDNVDRMVDELYFNQIAPPFDQLDDSVFLATPTYNML